MNEFVGMEPAMVINRDMENSYFSYPKTNTPTEVWIHCFECDESWNAGHILLKIAVELVES